ncbi:MAG: hypothetical protein ACE5FO_14315, partial [Parvularculaceae bacterium]
HEKIPYAPNLLSPELVRPGPKFVSNKIVDLAAYRDPRTMMRRKTGFAKRFMEYARDLPSEDWRQRKTISISRDTGYKLLERARNGGDVKYGMVTPVFDPGVEGFHPEVVFPVQRAAFVECFYPPERRYMPPRGTYSRTGFLERGYPNFRMLNWEEFLLDDEPFAFHVRGELQRGKTLGIDLHPAWLGLRAILQRQGRASLPELTPLKNEIADLAA